MNIWIAYLIIAVILMVAELVYFRIADRCNIIDMPNERSSHSSIVLRGGGIIFLFGMLIWTIAVLCGAFSETHQVYPWFLLAVTLAAGISFVDDIHSLPDSVRLVVQFIAMGLMILQLFLSARGVGLFSDSNLLINIVVVVATLVVCVGATNIYNFMDGINGITGAYSLAVLIPLAVLNRRYEFVDPALIYVAALSVLVFCFFNFRKRARCFAGDVGSVGIAFIILFILGRLIAATGDVQYLLLLGVYGIDTVLTIIHRILLHEHLGEAHRKHAYQLMANELHIPHTSVSFFYFSLQLIVSGGLLAVPDSLQWPYTVAVLMILALAYLLFMRKYYHLHAEYLNSLKS